jgi:hypothetical protein
MKVRKLDHPLFRAAVVGSEQGSSRCDPLYREGSATVPVLHTVISELDTTQTAAPYYAGSLVVHLVMHGARLHFDQEILVES